jgi:hypothetical protein
MYPFFEVVNAIAFCSINSTLCKSGEIKPNGFKSGERSCHVVGPFRRISLSEYSNFKKKI